MQNRWHNVSNYFTKDYVNIERLFMKRSFPKMISYEKVIQILFTVLLEINFKPHDPLLQKRRILYYPATQHPHDLFISSVHYVVDRFKIPTCTGLTAE